MLRDKILLFIFLPDDWIVFSQARPSIFYDEKNQGKFQNVSADIKFLYFGANIIMDLGQNLSGGQRACRIGDQLLTIALQQSYFWSKPDLE